jgi:hypothetical protein
MLGGAILLARCNPADIASAPADGRLDHMIGVHILRSLELSAVFHRHSTGMLR